MYRDRNRVDHDVSVSPSLGDRGRDALGRPDRQSKNAEPNKNLKKASEPEPALGVALEPSCDDDVPAQLKRHRSPSDDHAPAATALS
jgi:hypothetical protein